ncbi:winged helix-turn-helix domain-containing protein [Ensifer sp. SL37]|nr:MULTISPECIES: winged helix-turn-helix domain-containing protein [Ensifer]MCY1743682.1 winged helix-turn-helix domain-containing protein [Ensifer sp. SL37]MDF8355201.1 winged helix-turn-helix domain-containing protein [Ensifer adhaerens]
MADSVEPQLFAFGTFILDMERGALTCEGRRVAIGHKGLLLLHALVQASMQVVSKSALMEAAWPAAVVEESNLSVQIAALRKMLGPQPEGNEWIATVPRAGYRFAARVNSLHPAAADASPALPGSPANPGRPSIVVLPFANLSSDKQQSYLVDGITEDVITALTRFRWFRVIGRNSSFVYKHKSVSAKQVGRDLDVDYVLEGSVRRSGGRLRVSTQLVETTSASQVWAERYDLEMEEAFAVQDAIAERVAGAIEPELLKTASFPSPARHTGNLSAWEIVRQGTWYFHQVGQQTHLMARELFREACRLDPELAEAHLWLGRVSAGIVAYGWSELPSDDIREGLDAALAAVRLDEKNPYTHYALAICSAYANAPEQAVLAAERAIEISPSFALGHLVLGMAELFRGNVSGAIASLEHGLMLNANDPQNFVWLNFLALAHLFAGDGTNALAAAVKAQKVRPAWRPVQETLACCYAATGRLAEARSSRALMSEMENASGDALEPLRQRNPHWQERLAELLQQIPSNPLQTPQRS